MAARCDTLITNVRLATMVAGQGPYGAIEDGALAIAGGQLAFAGARAAMPPFDAATRHDAGGRWATPGLIDCHTHLVFGGDRAHEFELRLGGASYEEIARAGGGIRSTVAATRAASEDELLRSARRRLASLAADGVTTVEIKSGYGLDTATASARRSPAIASSIGPATRSTYSPWRPANSGGSACAPRKVVTTRTPLSRPSARATRSILASVAVSRP